ncbi:DNA polymerase III subunit delta' C-terminal domain-containing protein [Buchnera aphidicola]|uniref:DNA polymerase III subunit delta n=1 Tax=Buchnera aphidicola (Stegophylla sp.) TaxID=2315800 RepID=A0A4D6YKL7_9GAMM|nr:DNA polymerase III subunit delta' [Buchnera aphidicola (Stegophylla sp.)]QCI26390.1 DNA polymerase III subunit delta' [Buchnera aphidicola (Stegophylla sp.)]
MKITWNPWLKKYYKEIIQYCYINKLHHSIIIESYNIKDTFKLIWTLSQWILCNKKKNMKSCGICSGCTLVSLYKHPDFYVLYPKNKKKNIDIVTIRDTIHNILKTAQQNENKILWIPRYEFLTSFGINALLKIIEEPPKNTWFFIGNNKIHTLHKTLRSRCVLYQISQPVEKIGYIWMKKYIEKNKHVCLTSLRINYHSPELAINFLTSPFYEMRYNLYFKIHYAINNNKFVQLLPFIYDKNMIVKINWIILLLLDAMKIKKKFFIFTINLDQINLVKKISIKYSYHNLYNIIQNWIKCRYQLININNINYELLIINQLFMWENIILNK